MLQTGIPKADHFHLNYWEGAELVGPHKIPKLSPQQHIPHNVVSFNERNGIKHPENHWIDFFIDDINFESFWDAQYLGARDSSVVLERYWRRMDQYMRKLKQFEGVIATDHSLLPEMLPDQSNWNCVRNYVTAWRLEQAGIPTIPVASWRDLPDLEWCFDGLAENSSIAISTNGCLSSNWGKRLLIEGTKELVVKKKPFAIIVCGRELRELNNLHSNVIYYPSFSQRWQERSRHGR